MILGNFDDHLFRFVFHVDRLGCSDELTLLENQMRSEVCSEHGTLIGSKADSVGVPSENTLSYQYVR